jgi:hypothetical protein
VIKDRKGIMGYMSGGSYSALKREGIGSLRFHPGALVDMLESFGAVPENFEPRKKKQVPVTWFVEAGATGVHGAVAEPYAHTFPDTLLFERYTQGFNLAEAYYQSLPFLYWMNMVIGDPLAAPYAKAPEVALSAGGLEVVSGQILAQITAKPPQGTRIRALQLDFDGLPVGTARGAEGKIVWDTRKFRNGKGVLHAAAILDGPVAVQGHAFLDVEVRNAELTLVRTFPRDGEANASRAGPIRITCNKALAPACAGEGGLAVTVRDGDRVPGRWMVEEDRHVLAFLPGEPLAASTAFRVTVPPGVQCAEGKSLGGAPVSFGFTTTAASLALTAPNETTGGTAFDVEIKALDGKGELWPGFRGTVYLMGDDPHASFPAVIRFTAKDGGKRTVKVTLGASGERTLKAADFLAGVEGTVKVEVTSGLFEKIRVDLPRQTGLGQEVEVRFRAVDSFGNKVESVVGEFQIAAPAQSVAEHPKRLTFTGRGGGDARGMLLRCAGKRRHRRPRRFGETGRPGIDEGGRFPDTIVVVPRSVQGAAETTGKRPSSPGAGDDPSPSRSHRGDESLETEYLEDPSHDGIGPSRERVRVLSRVGVLQGKRRGTPCGNRRPFQVMGQRSQGPRDGPTVATQTRPGEDASLGEGLEPAPGLGSSNAERGAAFHGEIG